jgi:hypothetical protein
VRRRTGWSKRGLMTLYVMLERPGPFHAILSSSPAAG